MRQIAQCIRNPPVPALSRSPVLPRHTRHHRELWLGSKAEPLEVETVSSYWLKCAHDDDGSGILSNREGIMFRRSPGVWYWRLPGRSHSWQITIYRTVVNSQIRGRADSDHDIKPRDLSWEDGLDHVEYSQLMKDVWWQEVWQLMPSRNGRAVGSSLTSNW